MYTSKCGCKGCAIVTKKLQSFLWNILSSSEVRSSQIKDLKGNVKAPVTFCAVTGVALERGWNMSN